MCALPHAVTDKIYLIRDTTRYARFVRYPCIVLRSVCPFKAMVVFLERKNFRAPDSTIDTNRRRIKSGVGALRIGFGEGEIFLSYSSTHTLT